MTTQVFDYVAFIMDYEDGGLTDEEVIEGFRKLITSGNIRDLQGHYQRTAQAMLERGIIQLPRQGDVY